ncbi:MAG: NADH-quinone oxidoreductase subunit NuoG [Candidatus Zixiibacteriota bacterium]
MADNDNKITLTIDGQEISVKRGTTVLEAAKSMGIKIPTFCWHPKLKPVGACRMCYVEIEKRPKLEVSCATECMPDMVVHTQSEKVLKGRKAVLEFTLINHPLDCPTCDKGGECDLQDLTFAHATDDSRFVFKKYRFTDDNKKSFDDLRIGPEIIRNQNRCILCYRCVRSNKEIFGEYDLGAYQRGNMTEINAAPGQQVDSLYSGNLVEICPVGALTNTDWRYKIRTWKAKKTKSICQYCADGCNLTLWSGREKMYRATSRRNDDIDEGWICNVGRYGYQPANPANRLKTPMIKKGDTQTPVSWEEALGLIARKFKEIKDKKGGVCIGGLISPTLDSSSLYAFSKFFRMALGSNNVDFRTDYKMLPESYEDTYPSMTSLEFKIADIEKSDIIIVIGSNLIKDHPIVNLRVRKAVTKLGAKLFTINPFVTKSGDISTDEIIHKPGTLDALLNGICAGLVEKDKAAVKFSTEDLKSKLIPNTVADSAAISDVSAEQIYALVEYLGKAKNITIITGEIFTNSVARENLSKAVGNLTFLTDIQNGRGQVAILSKSANSKGAEKLGVMPYFSEKTQAQLKSIWGQYPECNGLSADRMILSATKEEIDSLFIIGANPIITYPDGQFIKEGTEKLNFMVVADLYETETTVLADVVLPLASWAEYSGTFVNLEGRVQEFQSALKPTGRALPAYEIIGRLAREMKVDWFDSVDKLVKEYKPLLEEKPEPRKIIFSEVRYVPEEINEEFTIPLYVIDELHHFGHLTEKSESLSAFCGEAFLEMSPSLAEKYHATDGTLLRVESEVGKVVLPVRISELLDNDVVLVPHNFSTVPVNMFQMRKRRIDRVKFTRVEEK